MKAIPKNQIPEALANFDQLPDAAHVSEAVVAALYDASHTSVWRYVKKGMIPAPKRLTGRRTVWNVGDLRKALAAA